MLRSLYSGISGLRAHQTLMDVVGNNIANVNTTGYKSASVEFQDTLSQVVSSSGKPSTGVGGVDPTQVGLGVKVAGTGTSWTQGASQLTGKNTDMMISGDGFFITKAADGTQSYTRDGSFKTDALGQLATVDGNLLQGWVADSTGTVNTNGPIANLAIPVTGTVGAPAKTTTLSLSGNLPSNYSTVTTGTPTPNVIGPVPQTVYDALGNSSTVYVQYTHTAAQTWTLSTASTSAMTGATTQTINFGADGKPNTTAGAAASANTGVSLITVGSGTPSYTLNVANLTGYAGSTGSTGTATSSTVTATGDGSAAGAITAYTIGADGTITASFDNGLKKVLGQIAVAAFTNPSGLIKAGSSSYVTSSNSGTANVGTAGTGGRGSTTSGALEMSNVDLSQEFTNLIVAQRGFQANSRIITTADQLLQTLVQMGQ